jgi:exopolyphosphatase/pppGpp-phosphohydrolase
MAKLLPTLSLEERVTKLYIEEARADVILGGVLILEQIMDILEQKEALVSEKDILDATASSLL